MKQTVKLWNLFLPLLVCGVIALPSGLALAQPADTPDEKSAPAGGSNDGWGEGEEEVEPGSDEEEFGTNGEACIGKERCNPWMGGLRNLWAKIGIFLIIVLAMHLLLSFGLFGAQIQGGGEPSSSFGMSMGLTIIVSALAAFFSFVEYTWPEDWCQKDLCSASISDQMGAVTWWVWGLVGGVAVVLFIIFAASFKPSNK